LFSFEKFFFFKLDWTKKDPSKLTISRPTNFNHPIHVTYNSSTGEFDGMPEIWSSLLQHSKITKQEQKQNPQAVIHALDFYQHAAQKRESKFMYSSYKSKLFNLIIKFVKLDFFYRFNTTHIQRRFSR
jgi:hypothetical protein